MTLEVSIGNMSFAYRSSDGSHLPIFSNVTLSLRGGSIVGVVGRNGSGKSTLFNLIRGRIAPDMGNIGIRLDKLQDCRAISALAMVSLVTQLPDSSLCPTMTIFENYALVRSAGKWSTRLVFARAEREACRNLVAVAGMGLERNVDEQIRFLSGGQKQALSVLLALSLDRSILLMDEPTAALDHFSAVSVLNIAAGYGRKNNGIVAIISHKIDELLSVCDELVVVGNGEARQFTRQDIEWTVAGIQSLL